MMFSTEGESSIPDGRTANHPLNESEGFDMYHTPEKDRFVPTSIKGSNSPQSVIENLQSTYGATSVVSNLRHNEESSNDSLLRVQVESSVQKTTFYVPVSLMLQREKEMQDSARRNQVGKDRWSGSRLYSMWRNARQNNPTPNANYQEEITLCLTPESTMQGYSELTWKPWLTTCMRAYYNTGTIRIPEDCLGSDILLALEYFGILTASPDAFIFDKQHSLDRIQCWSSYFTHRDRMVEWVLSDFKMKGATTRVWVTTNDPAEMNPSETLLQVNGATASLLLGGPNKSNFLPLTCRTVHDFFFECDSEHRLSREMPARMRRDFCSKLKRQMRRYQTSISFDIERVKITKSTGRISSVLRAVLSLHAVEYSHAATQNRQGVVSNLNRSHSPSHTNRAQNWHSPERGPGLSSPGGLQQSASEETELARIAQAQDDSPRRVSHSGNTKPVSHRKETPAVAPARYERQQTSVVSTPFDEAQFLQTRRPLHPAMRQRRHDMPAGLPKTETEAMQNRFEASDPFMPVGYINTAFGDLQSVTSALSDPRMDESTVASISSQFLTKKVSQRGAALAWEGRNNGHQQADVFDRDFQMNNIKPGHLFAKDDGRIANDGAKSQEYGYWEGLLASMCDAVIPGSSKRSSSPVQEITMETTVGDIPMHTSLRRDANQSQLDTTRDSEMDISKKTSEESAILDAAKSIGVSLTNQFDDFMKLALDTAGGSVETNSHAPREHVGRVSKSSRSRAVRGGDHARESKSKYSSSAPRQEKEEIFGQVSRRKAKINQSKSSAFAEAQVRIPEKVGRLEDVRLPPREPSRARVRKPSIRIARKRQSAQVRESPASHIDTRGQSPDVSSASISKAKVRSDANGKPMLLL